MSTRILAPTLVRPAGRSRRGHGASRGAIIVTAALALLLLGFMGIALDFGRLFIVRTELQTALTAARWPPRANSTSKSGCHQPRRERRCCCRQLNGVNLQSANWSGQARSPPPTSASATPATSSTTSRPLPSMPSARTPSPISACGC
jgi:Flp pilus assembly protein TadG